MQELFTLRNGIGVADERISQKLFRIQAEKPESKSYDSTPYEWNEMGMSELFGILYKEETRYCPEFRAWYSYENGYWHKDEGGIILSEKIKEFVRIMTLYALDIEDEQTRTEYLKYINKLGDRRLRERVARDASGTLMINASEFDTNPYLINCLNGTYDLKTATFREHRADDFITMRTNFSHTVDRHIRCERWEQFIDEVTEQDKEKADYLQRALGYSLLGIANEECMFILHGKTTRNGKSTLLNTIESMLGDYSKVAPVGMICRDGKVKDVESASPMLAGLKGKRFVTMAESNESGRLDEEKIKQYTGGEAISARALYQAAITFTPQFTLWLSCNDLPMVTDKSLFASERIKVIEFNRHFSPEEQDKNLKTEFMTNEARSAIFLWLVRGYQKYLRKGLAMPKKMKDVIDNYERENDLVLQFLEAKCEKDENAKIPSTELHKKYRQWCKDQGMTFIYSAFKFNNEMQRHPDWLIGISNPHNIRTYQGIRLREVTIK